MIPPPDAPPRNKKEKLKHKIALLDGAHCRYCGSIKWAQLTVEHLTPRFRGGIAGVENLGLSCKLCNNLKGCLTEEEFLRFREPCGENGEPYFQFSAIKKLKTKILKEHYNARRL